jgi:four helix bundle protein
VRQPTAASNGGGQRQRATAATDGGRFSDVRRDQTIAFVPRSGRRWIVPSEFRLLDLARQVVDEVHRLLDAGRPRLLNENQLRECASSITANIREGLGRRRGRERDQFMRYAKASAEETDERLRTNYKASRLSGRTFWRLHDRLAVIGKIIDALQ